MNPNLQQKEPLLAQQQQQHPHKTSADATASPDDPADETAATTVAAQPAAAVAATASTEVATARPQQPEVKRTHQQRHGPVQNVANWVKEQDKWFHSTMDGAQLVANKKAILLSQRNILVMRVYMYIHIYAHLYLHTYV